MSGSPFYARRSVAMHHPHLLSAASRPPTTPARPTLPRRLRCAAVLRCADLLSAADQRNRYLRNSRIVEPGEDQLPVLENRQIVPTLEKIRCPAGLHRLHCMPALRRHTACIALFSDDIVNVDGAPRPGKGPASTKTSQMWSELVALDHSHVCARWLSTI